MSASWFGSRLRNWKNCSAVVGLFTSSGYSAYYIRDQKVTNVRGSTSDGGVTFNVWSTVIAQNNPGSCPTTDFFGIAPGITAKPNLAVLLLAYSLGKKFI